MDDYILEECNENIDNNSNDIENDITNNDIKKNNVNDKYSDTKFTKKNSNMLNNENFINNLNNDNFLNNFISTIYPRQQSESFENNIDKLYNDMLLKRTQTAENLNFKKENLLNKKRKNDIKYLNEDLKKGEFNNNSLSNYYIYGA